MRAFFSALALLVLSAIPVYAHEITGMASVVDGNTLEIHGQRIRLHGVDAPESDQICFQSNSDRYRCGQESALKLSDYIARKTVKCSWTSKDKYQRIVAICYLGGVDLNKWQVLNGWALAYREYSLDYIDPENEAERKKAGIWQGKFDKPWDWRNGSRQAVQNPPVLTNISPKPSPYSYGGKDKCGQMTSRAEAMHYLRVCGVHTLDNDKDGIPCETLCR